MAVPRRTLTHLRKLANQVGQTTDDSVRALAASWMAAWDDLSPAWQQAIAVLVDEFRRTGVWPAPWRIARIEAVARAQERTERSLTVLVAESAMVTRRAAGVVSEATLKAEPGIIRSQGHGITVTTPVVQAAGALSRRQTRITALHAPLTAAAMASVRRVLVRPPSGAAPQLDRDLYHRTRAGFETALVRASTIVRTELPDTYRTTAGLVHAANPQIVTGWAWHCLCTRTSCPACWALHGQTFPTEIPGPASHPGCKCTRLPLTSNVSLPSAEARFKRLTRREQIAILGPARWELWHAGQLPWSAMAVQRDNPGWRTSWVPRPVTDLRRRAGIRS